MKTLTSHSSRPGERDGAPIYLRLRNVSTPFDGKRDVIYMASDPLSQTSLCFDVKVWHLVWTVPLAIVLVAT